MGPHFEIIMLKCNQNNCLNYSTHTDCLALPLTFMLASITMLTLITRLQIRQTLTISSKQRRSLKKTKYNVPKCWSQNQVESNSKILGRTRYQKLDWHTSWSWSFPATKGSRLETQGCDFVPLWWRSAMGYTFYWLKCIFLLLTKCILPSVYVFDETPSR